MITSVSGNHINVIKINIKLTIAGISCFLNSLFCSFTVNELWDKSDSINAYLQNLRKASPANNIFNG